MFNFMKLAAKIGIDDSEYNKGIDKAENRFKGLGNLLSSGGKAIGGAISGTLKATGVAMASAATGIAALTKSAYSAYADYEQLTGGVETLFGNSYSSIEEYAKSVGKSVSEVGHEWEEYEKRSSTVMENAKNAYKTAGMTANEYMETVTSFAASLNSSLGEYSWQSANYADMAIRDMADNANKMGTSMESIQNAYMGFSKGQFNMLDNLKLGYGGTKTEMERLMRDAEKLAGYKVGSLDVSNFADVVDAIHIVQEEMGITGTTVAEADKTISGSFASMKAAFQNLVAGFANPDADISELIGNLVGSAKNLINNAVPVISQALKGIGEAVTELIPVIAEELPKLFEELLPPLLQAATSLVQTLAANLPSILDVFVQQLPTILPPLIAAAGQIFSAIAEQIPTLIEILSETLLTELPKIMEKLHANIGKISSGLARIFKALGQLFTKLLPTILPVLLKIGVELIKELAKGFTENAQEIIKAVIEIITLIVQLLTEPDTLKQLLQCGLQILMALVEGILNNLDELLACLGLLIVNIVTFLVDAIPELVTEIGKNGAKIITEVIPNLLIKIGEAGGELLGKIIETVGGWWSDIVEKATEVFGAIGDGLLGAWDYVTGKIGEFGSKVWGGIKEAFSGMWEYGKELGTKIWNGLKSMFGKLRDALNPKNWFSGGAIDVGEMAVDMVVKQGYSEETARKATEILKEQGEEAAQAYLDGQEKGYDINSPSKKMAYIGRMVMAGFSEGIEKEAPSSFDDIDSTFRKFTPEISAVATVNGKENAGDGNGAQKQPEPVGDTTCIINIGGRQFAEFVLDSKRRLELLSGGQVNV